MSLSEIQFSELEKRTLAKVEITIDTFGSIAAIGLPEDYPIFFFFLSVIYELNISLNMFCFF